MASSAEVQLTLSLVQGQDDYPVRSIIIPADNYVTVGRSSRDQAKSLVASPHNLWLSGMIVSRSHASFSYERNGSGYVVYVEDVGSMHGTYLVDTADNGEFDIQLPRGVKTVVSNGDVIRFGVQLSKSAHNMGLRPPAFRCEMKHFESIDITSPGKSFSVPEGSVNDSDCEILDDDLYGGGGEAAMPSPSIQSEPTSPPPDGAGEDKRRIEMLCAAAHSAEESFIPESIPSNTQNLWSFGNVPPLKRTYDDAELDVPETAEELGWEPEAQSGATVEEPVLGSVEQPVASSSEQMAIKNLVTEVEERPATATAEQPSVETEVQAKPEQSQPAAATCAATSSERPRKRSRIGVAWGVACFLAGSVGTVATLASLPEGYFA